MKELFALDEYRVHNGARVVREGHFLVTTPDPQWAYAISFPLLAPYERDGFWLIEVDLQVERGQAGVGLLTPDGSGFLTESIVAGQATVNLRVPGSSGLGALVIRNAGSAGAGWLRVDAIRSRHESRSEYPYLVNLPARDVTREPRPDRGGVEVFDDSGAESINTARIDWLARLAFDFTGKRVLDVGAGVGYFSRYYADQGATVIAVEGRAENVAVLKERHPDITAHTADVQFDDIGAFGTFDVVHCFGLLYHLDSPVIALRRMHGVCRDVVLIETMVCDSPDPILVLADETLTVNQALAGLGCRPSPSFMALALNRVGFAYVYGTQHPPQHPDFQFEWRGQGDVSRDGHNLRCVFVASRRSLVNSLLLPLL